MILFTINGMMGNVCNYKLVSLVAIIMSIYEFSISNDILWDCAKKKKKKKDIEIVLKR